MLMSLRCAENVLPDLIVKRSRQILCLLVCLVLIGCGAVPRPFSPGPKSGGLPPPGPASALIVHPFAGNEEAPLGGLTAAVVADLQKNEVAAIQHDTANRYRMLGQADAIALVGDEVTLLFHIRFARPDLSEIATDSWEVQADWAAYLSGDPTLIRDLARQVTARMLTLMGLAPEPDPDGREQGVDLLMAPIGRAPGDGQQALSRAMVKELTRLGMKIEKVDTGVGTGLPELTALVSVAPMDASNDLVRIIWLLRDSDGRERGRLEQQNAVPTGRLNRRWGVVAQLAAAAAAPGVADLLQRLRQSQ